VDTGPILSAQWLVRFRWAVAAGAAAMLLVGWSALGLRFDVRVVGATLAVQVASNVWFALQLRRRGRASPAPLGEIALLDVALLTAIILATGGPSNPFTIGYLVYIALAATMFNARWAWIVTVASIVSYGLLFVPPLRLLFGPHEAHALSEPDMAHQTGMWIAFLMAALLVAAFVTRIRAAFEARERALADARRAAAQQERLASLTTLAAGAAHELATPLATIAVAARELDRAAGAPATPAGIAEDARLIRTEVERCREILDQMSGRADDATTQNAEPMRAGILVDRARSGLDEADRHRIHGSYGANPVVLLPPSAAARALRTLLKNALDASRPDQPIEVIVSAHGDHVRFDVRDEGVGMIGEVLARAGEPFFTTKPAGAGFGLGLFLVRTFAERWRGRLELESAPGAGTTVSLIVPAAAAGVAARTGIG
jgi:two-component system, sensor histidine kinase RegB